MFKWYIPSPDEYRLLDELDINSSDDLVRYYERTYDERVAHIYRFIMSGSTEPTVKYMVRLERLRN